MLNMLKNLAFAAVLLLCYCQISLAQNANDAFPSVEDMVKSMTGGKNDMSLESSTKGVIESMMQQMQTTENTIESVKSAIEGTLVVEETIPDINRSVVEAIDPKTKRYPPRLKLDFLAFPLRPLSGKIIGTVDNVDSTDLFDQTNSVITADIARRIQDRLKIQNVNFEFRNRTVMLSGTVETPRQRELAEMMVRMEPGIDNVKNEIIVKNP